jgi:hypothetical protein
MSPVDEGCCAGSRKLRSSIKKYLFSNELKLDTAYRLQAQDARKAYLPSHLSFYVQEVVF